MFKVDTEKLELIKVYVYGGDVRLIHFLLIFCMIDIITGIIKSVVTKQVRSKSIYVGYLRKFLIFFIVIMSNIVDQLLQLNGMLLFSTIMFYIVMECTSIIENLGEIGVPIPEVISEKVALLNNKESNKND